MYLLIWCGWAFFVRKKKGKIDLYQEIAYKCKKNISMIV